ncbi:MAG: hypothetical protein M1825_004767 [Sarcosagium campestre]|nr:MAG: hypothetical protein M1825_004767 [Sarcosagium campestre]
MNCGRHECGDRCCTGERRAAERQLSKRKVRPLRTRLDEDFEAEHICTRSCGRILKCGNHACLELCHKGPCGSCREAIFDEIACNCGRTVLQPPLPCGTTLPFCKWDCDRAKACGHPQVQHNCHSDAEPCPRCPFLTRKSCLCGKKSLANQQCWLLDVRCGEVCGKLLRCGSHHCRLPCHRPGQCEDSESACRQVCSKAKKSCGHPCQDTCHAPYPCREEKPCTHKVIITCQCQHQKQEVQCRHSKDGDGGETKQLGCVDECARLERNRKLALALNVDPKTHTDDHVPYSKDTLDGFQENRAWAIGQERLFRMFAANDEEKRIRSKPAPPAQRAFLHALAEDYGFDSESLDPEPHRHVVIFKTPRFVGPPMKTLSQCEAIRATSSRPQAVSTQSTAANAIPSFNGYLLVDPRFGLTLEDVRASFRSVFETTPALSFSINFLPSEEIVLKSSSDSLTREGMDALLRRSLAAFAAASSTNKLAASTQLCTTDDSLNVLRREPDGKETGGWSRVAARAAAPRTYKPESGVGVKSGFAILESEARRRKREEAAALKEQEKAAVAPVVEDWEQAEEEEEAAEVAGARETGKVEGERVSEDTSS